MFAWVALLFATGHAAAQLRSSDFRFTPDLDVKVLHGYPVTRHGYYGPIVFGLELSNRGEERTIKVDVQSPARVTRVLRVPPGEGVRAFFALPMRGGFSYGASAVFELTDSISGKRRRVTADSDFQTDEPLARLGPIAEALNVSKPFVLIGALDGRVPDDYRGLSGVRAIVVDHAYASTHVREWRTLTDWVAMGGVLLVATPRERALEQPPWGSKLPFGGPVQETETGLLQPVGHGAIVRLWPELLADVSADFFGRIGVSTERMWSVSDYDVSQERAPKAAHERLAGMVVDAGWGLFGVLGVFAIVVGPIGWSWLVRRRGQALRYLAFVVACATLFSLAVLGHDMFENGIDPKAVARSLVLIDQRTGSELGIEDAALYAPTRRGTDLHVPPGGLALLPGAQSLLDVEPLELPYEPATERQRVGGALSVRRRELAAVRWLRDRRGGLEIEPEGSALWVENQTGRDLQSLVLWRAGASYRLAELARGARARAEPISAQQANDAAPKLASGLLVGNGAGLARALIAGQLGEDRYAATYAWSPSGSALLDSVVRSRGGKQHVLAGVF